jgi:hypothetical protein
VIVDSFAELRITQPMEALLLAGSYLTIWTYYLPRPLLKSMAPLLPPLADGPRCHPRLG